MKQFGLGLNLSTKNPFRVLERRFGFTKVRYRSLAKSTAQIVTLFVLSNLWMARRQFSYQ